MCEDKPVVKTSYVDEEECEAVTREECVPVTREECSQVVEKVPHQSTKEVSRVKFGLVMWNTVYHFSRIIPRRFQRSSVAPNRVCHGMKCEGKIAHLSDMYRLHNPTLIKSYFYARISQNIYRTDNLIFPFINLFKILSSLETVFLLCAFFRAD